MADCQYLRGRSAADVIRVLGAPSEQDAFGISYEVGPDGLGIDSEFLTFWLARDGRVTAVEVDGW
jgi:hypothetical protein